MSKTVAVLIAGISFAAVCASVGAQQLPKSGSISFHTGWKDAFEVNEVAEKRYHGWDHSVGSTFNDRGAGPLHLGPANCYSAFFVVEGNGSNKGYCAFGDPDGDRLFTEFTGTLSPNGAEGTNTIASGTGKYSGITGSGPWKCKLSGKNGELQCAQRLDYKLP